MELLSPATTPGGAIIGIMAEGSMTWTEVAGRLAAARTYWLGSTTASGAPHAAPVWGVVSGETLHLYSERSTVKAHNLAADPRVIVHLESGEDVLIVRGVAVVWGIRPRSAMDWRLDDYEASQRRWPALS